ncbi:MAG TPA: hypothetical protein EYM59_07060 [Acidimicrobiia bacterium]|nr:hypothetical protein [Acidimicrobiia bacterium]
MQGHLHGVDPCGRGRFGPCGGGGGAGRRGCRGGRRSRPPDSPRRPVRRRLGGGRPEPVRPRRPHDRHRLEALRGT